MQIKDHWELAVAFAVQILTDSPKCPNAEDQNLCAAWSKPISYSALLLSLLWKYLERIPKAESFFYWKGLLSLSCLPQKVFLLKHTEGLI